MSIERFLLVNLFMDWAILALAARSCGTFSLARTVSAAMIGTVYACAAMTAPGPWTSLPFQILLLAALSHLITGRASARVTGIAPLLLAAGALVSGGAAHMLRSALYSPAAVLCAALAGLLLFNEIIRQRNPARFTPYVNIALKLGEKTIRFQALVDTGNRLREPLSGQPVLIAESRLLRGDPPSDGQRRVPFGALGGNGWLACFRPAAAWVEKDRRRMPLPPFWVGVVPGRLPGPASALAPCEFANLKV